MATAYHQTLTQTRQHPRTTEQLSLPFPIQAAPPIVRAHGLQDTHSFPLVARAKGESFRVSPLQAWHFLLLEIRAGNSYPLLTLDCDGPASVQAFWLTQLNSQLPEPSWVVRNPATGNLAAVLVPGQTPCIAAKPPARQPLHLFARACEFFRWICEADTGFVGCLQRNPVQEPHKTFWGRTAPFELAELVGCLPAGWKMPRVPKTAVGRNDGLFRALCSFVGTPSNYHVSPSELAAVADMKNQAFALHGLPPLDRPEVAGIVRSVYRRHQRKLCQRGAATDVCSFIQSNRAKKGGQKRREKRADRDAAIIQAVQAEGQSMRSVVAAAIWVSQC